MENAGSVYATGNFANSSVILTADGKKVLDENFDFSPANVFSQTIELGSLPEGSQLEVLDEKGHSLVTWQQNPMN
ncbi:hypothetical protein QWY93_13345 [Echinicola jeungdonensis]|uniref:hypothetical protein n=1 Tax=Echinicola jeungdonensis TaxID=709343 RepID=UPI0025B56635|nr:hypothetical protein [Echinicola jeungdonensis]MDN3670310.1 hypothetical protein [Echinicola jeungdonensis]